MAKVRSHAYYARYYRDCARRKLVAARAQRRGEPLPQPYSEARCWPQNATGWAGFIREDLRMARWHRAQHAARP